MGYAFLQCDDALWAPYLSFIAKQHCLFRLVSAVGCTVTVPRTSAQHELGASVQHELGASVQHELGESAV
eukprot:332581-Rhodomonas_salina.5